MIRQVSSQTCIEICQGLQSFSDQPPVADSNRVTDYSTTTRMAFVSL